MLPGGALNRIHGEFKFNAHNIRFTIDKKGAFYTFCMNVPTSGALLKIKSLGTDT